MEGVQWLGFFFGAWLLSVDGRGFLGALSFGLLSVDGRFLSVDGKFFFVLELVLLSVSVSGWEVFVSGWEVFFGAWSWC